MHCGSTVVTLQQTMILWQHGRGDSAGWSFVTTRTWLLGGNVESDGFNVTRARLFCDDV
jgi:hypothetical protein